LGARGRPVQIGPRPPRSAIETYLRQVEPIRLAVNRLLGRADPILKAYHDHGASPAQAGRRMDRLERRFAAYTVEVAAIEPATVQLRVLHAAYAYTYVLEDAYLSVRAAGLAGRKLDGLPATQAAQRAAIIGWRTGLSVLADRAGVALPADLQQAGRGEVAPSPDGS
jgi:ribosome modulation factor